MADFATIYIQKWLSDAKLLEKKQTQPFTSIEPEKRRGKLSHSSITIDEDFAEPEKSQIDKIKSDPEQQLRLKKFFKISDNESFLYDDTCEWLNYGEFDNAQNATPSSTSSTPDITPSGQQALDNNLLTNSQDSDTIDIRSGKICITSHFVLFFQGDVMKLPVDGIVKEDNITVLKNVKRVLFESNSWPTRYLVLTQLQLQIYDSLDCKKDYMVRVMVPLSDIHSVTKYVPTPDSKKKFGFQVLTSRKMYTFGCENNAEVTSWIDAIKSILAKEEDSPSSVEILLPIKSITEIAKIQHSFLYPKSIRISTSYGYQFVFSTPSFTAAYNTIQEQLKNLPVIPVPKTPKINENVIEELEFADPNSSGSQEFRKIFGLPESEKLIAGQFD